MTEPLIQYAVRPPAAVLTLNRPDKRNALNRPLIAALAEAVHRAQDDAAVRCVILTGAGSAFCAGMDLAELSQTLDLPDEAAVVQADAQRLSDLYDLIYRLPKPTLAAVNGPAVAGGAGLVTVCDLALAEPAARFGYPEVRRGLVAAMVMPHLLRHVGERGARDLLLRAELIDAAEAQRIGLINAVTPAGRVLETALEWARAVAQAGPGALATTKEFLRLFDRQQPRAQFARGSADARLTVECKAGLRAFLDKRPAPWAAATPPGGG
jgi:methylglutaconyl-CoA hydratase